jgi:AraC-like DNA-binding protein
MDILSEVLQTIRFSGAIELRAEFSAPWVIETAPCYEFAEALQSYTKRLVPFHIIAEGSCWVKTTQNICQALSAGDIIIFPHGDSHILGDQLNQPPIPVDQVLPQPPWKTPLVLRYGGGGAITRVVCGFFQCEELGSHPFLKTLPAFMHIQAFADTTVPLVAAGVRHIIQAVNGAQPGNECVLTRLVELMFVEILRNQIQTLSHPQIGALAALNDPVVSQVLEWFHIAPTYAWTVPELAERVQMSRSALAQRFTQQMGQPPMQYLNQWRLQLASRQLQDTNEPIAKIATQVGYESEAAFSRAFKRYVGMTPGSWRKVEGRCSPID